MVEGDLSRAACRVHQHELAAAGNGVAVPEAIVCQPIGADRGVKHQRRRVIPHPLFGACVVLGRETWTAGVTLLGDEGRGKQYDSDERDSYTAHALPPTGEIYTTGAF